MKWVGTGGLPCSPMSEFRGQHGLCSTFNSKLSLETINYRAKPLYCCHSTLSHPRTATLFARAAVLRFAPTCRMAGASYDIVVLSSSPPDARDAAAAHPRSPTSAQARRVAMPAPSSQSLSPLFSPQMHPASALRSGSRAAAVPEGAGRGFATARSLLADMDITDSGLSAIEQVVECRRMPTGPEGTIKATRPRKPRATKAAAAAAAEGTAEKPKAKRGRKPKAGTTEQSAGDGLSAGFITSSHFAQAPAIDAVGPPEPKLTKARKPRAKKGTAADGEIQTTIAPAKVTKPRAPRKTTKKAQEKAAEVVSAHFQSRATSEKTAGTEEPSGAAADGSRSLVSADSTWDVPASPSARSRGPPKQKPPDRDPDLPLDLDAAVGRRRDWTPPPETVHRDVLTSSTGKENRPDAVDADKPNFTSMLSGFSYSHLDAQPEPQAASVMKRRRVDVSPVRFPSQCNQLTSVQLVGVPANGATRQISPTKGKAPKKKARTITDLVTGQYAPQPIPESPDVTSDFFARRTSTVTETTKVPLNDTTAAESSKANKKPVRRRSSSKARSDDGEGKPKPKPRKAASKAAKPKPVAEKLLSPSSAAFRVSRQDILFGTSSQLAREDSPTMVREIQRAIRESECDADARDVVEPLAVAPWPRLQRIEGRRALWRASSRDEEGGTLDREDVYLPEPDRTQDIPLLMDATQAVGSDEDDGFLDIDRIHALPEGPSQDDFLYIGDLNASEKVTVNLPVTISSDLPTPPPTIPEDNSAIADAESDSPPFHDINDFPQDHGLPPSGQNQEANTSFFDIDDFAPSTQPPLPSISAGSPTKKRRGRPPLSQSAIPSKPTAPPPQKPPDSAPPRAPSTPRRPKDRFIDIDEILDSEDDHALSPTPPRTRPLSLSPPLALALAPSPSKSKTKSPPKSNPKAPPTPVSLIPASHLLFEHIRPTLFAAITSLVRSLPPSTALSIPNKPGGQEPNWHEKILLYDPIVVEAFTGWINGHPERVERGVCVWRRARAGEGRAWERYVRQGDAGDQEEEGEVGGGEVGGKEGEGDGDAAEMVQAVRKDVEAWMVKRWCEERGVCAVSREGKKGGARRGLY